MSASLEFRAVSKSYPNSDQPAVCEVNLEVCAGEILALVGESGSGKTTLLRLAAGLERPDEGEIRVGDDLVAGSGTWWPPEKRPVGLVFQDGALFPHLTAAANIRYGLKGLARDRQDAVIDYLMAMAGLSGYQDRFPHELSGGERQRLAVVRALAPRPKVILLDEPFSNLDPALRRGLRDELRRMLQKLKATAILVTHDTDDALIVGDRIVVFHDGRIEQEGRPNEIYHWPKSGYCARLFGPANEIAEWESTEKPRWVRPENLELCHAETEGAIRVRIEQIRDAGRRVEVFVQREGSQEARDRWLVARASAQGLEIGEVRGVRWSSAPADVPAA